MSTVWHPVGPRPARVYWVRRLVLLAAVVVLVLAAWGLASAARGRTADRAEPPVEAAVQPAGATTSPEATEPDEGPRSCDRANLRVTLAASGRVFAGDDDPALTWAVTNVGDDPCTVDAGSGALVLTITSGPDRIWSSADCVAEEDEQLLLLAPGAKHRDSVTWQRVRSDEACTKDLAEPRPGTYQAVATFRGVTSSAAVLQLT